MPKHATVYPSKYGLPHKVLGNSVTLLCDRKAKKKNIRRVNVGLK